MSYSRYTTDELHWIDQIISLRARKRELTDELIRRHGKRAVELAIHRRAKALKDVSRSRPFGASKKKFGLFKKSIDKAKKS